MQANTNMSKTLSYHLKRFFSKSLDTLLTKQTSDGVSYIWKRRHSPTLIIVFSGIGKLRYNYKSSLWNSSYDLLFIADCWAGGVSYYWYENKSDHPERFTQALIDKVLAKGNYSSVITVGSSKGGTAAIYYGLKINADRILAGACQYYVGDYLSRHQRGEHPEQWKAVVGEGRTQEWIDILDRKLPDMIAAHRNSKTQVFLLYSTDEHTYPEHVKPLIEQLNAYGIAHEDQVEHFPEHSMIGGYFRDAIKESFFRNK